jgi:predicted GNAT family acetyltransferase
MAHNDTGWEVVDMTASVNDNPSECRYEIHLNGELAGYCAYQKHPGMIVFTHTEVEARFRGKGVGSRLIAAALADAERRELTVVPRCDFVKDFIRRGDLTSRSGNLVPR